MLQLRIFTRRPAREVDPGDALERPRAMRVDEVHKTLDGLRLIGWPTSGADHRRVSVDLKPDDPIEAPVQDQDTIIDVLREAFTALRDRDKDDDIDADVVFDFTWLPDERGFNVKTPTGWVLMTLVVEPPAAPPEKPKAKTAKASKATPPPADTEPDLST
jgi:hypothetical protein